MKKESVIILIFIVSINTVACAQLTKYFTEQFPKEPFPNKAPFCITYSHEEQVGFGAIFHVDTVEGELVDFYETNENYESDESRLLPLNIVEQHLLPDVKFIYKTDLRTGDTLLTESIDEYLDGSFYGLHMVYKSKAFYAVTYERIFSTGLTSSEKFLCTFSKEGKFISRILIASFIHSGSGTSASGAKFPWFPMDHGCINADLTADFYSQTEGDRKYKIQPDGKLIVIKSR